MNNDTAEREAICAHNFIFVRRSTYAPPPYYICSRCGQISYAIKIQRKESTHE